MVPAGVQEEMLANGYLLRQGTVLGFTWKKHYWVLTANGSLHEGILQWQDPEFLALQSVGSEWPKLIKRSQVSQISSLSLAKEPTQVTIPSSRPCLPPT